MGDSSELVGALFGEVVSSGVKISGGCVGATPIIATRNNVGGPIGDQELSTLLRQEEALGGPVW